MYEFVYIFQIAMKHQITKAIMEMNAQFQRAPTNRERES